MSEHIHVIIELKNGRGMILEGIKTSFEELIEIITDKGDEEIDIAGNIIKSDDLNRIREIDDETLEELKTIIGGNKS